MHPLRKAPPGIETQAHVEVSSRRSAAAVKKAATRLLGLRHRLLLRSGPARRREVTTKPVLGIAECGILTALTLGQRFGVISILKKSIPRHLRYVGQMA